MLTTETLKQIRTDKIKKLNAEMSVDEALEYLIDEMSKKINSKAFMRRVMHQYKKSIKKMRIPGEDGICLEVMADFSSFPKEVHINTNSLLEIPIIRANLFKMHIDVSYDKVSYLTRRIAELLVAKLREHPAFEVNWTAKGERIRRYVYITLKEEE